MSAFVFYGCVGIDPKFSGLKQNLFVVSQFHRSEVRKASRLPALVLEVTAGLGSLRRLWRQI